MAGTVTGGVGERRLLGLDCESEQPARSATKLSVARGIRPEFVTA